MAKKSFLPEENPAMQFISGESVEAVEGATTPTGQPTAGYRVEYVEKRTKRVQLVLQPSLYAQAKKEAKKLGVSFNDYVHRAIAAYMDGGSK